LLGALAVALFPPALLLLAEPRRTHIPVWIASLAGSLAAGLLVAVSWRDSPPFAGLPLATWLVWLFAAVLPFVLIVLGLVVRDPDA